MTENTNFEIVKCNICEDETKNLFFIENGYSVVKCKNCELVYVNPRPLDHTHGAVSANSDPYAGYIRDYTDHQNGHNMHFREILNEILRLRPSRGNLLEIGCAAGFFLDAAKKEGFHVKGIEQEESNARYALKKLSLDVNVSSFESVQFPENHFDIIVALNVLSHLRDPLRFFEKVNSILKSDGLFVFETGNKAEMKSKWRGEILGENWLTPEHLYHFSDNSLAILVNKAGFKVKTLAKTHVVDHLLSKRVLSLNRSTKKKWLLKKLLMKFDIARIMIASLLKFYFIYLLKADVSSLLYIVEKK